jgi:hypothetical protein
LYAAEELRHRDEAVERALDPLPHAGVSRLVVAGKLAGISA